ncbi:MAG: class I SAM-dependent methyltransferase [Candidatus Acidiferrales bacterium]
MPETNPVTPPGVNLWTSAEHALDYLRRADSIPHRVEGEAALIEFLPRDPRRVLDLGTGAGRLLALVKAARPQAQFTGLDFSPTMLEALRKQFSGDASVAILAHDFDKKLPPLPPFDAVISSFAIHHVAHDRKRALYREIFHLLAPGGVFCNLEHVASPTAWLHSEFLRAISWADEDPSNKLLDVETQLAWLREIGFQNVDCHWKWRELALFAASKPGKRG